MINHRVEAGRSVTSACLQPPLAPLAPSRDRHAPRCPCWTHERRRPLPSPLARIPPHAAGHAPCQCRGVSCARRRSCRLRRSAADPGALADHFGQRCVSAFARFTPAHASSTSFPFPPVARLAWRCGCVRVRKGKSVAGVKMLRLRGMSGRAHVRATSDSRNVIGALTR